MRIFLDHPNYTGYVDADIDYEVLYTAESGCSTIIPINESWKTIAVQTSGGADSALLLYLTAKTIKDKNLPITVLPVSVEVPTKAKTLSYARNVIKKVKELLNFDQFETPLEYHMPLEDAISSYKNKFFSSIMASIVADVANIEFNGNTKNPPESARKFFKNDITRELRRDNRVSIYNGIKSASPHAMMDKQDIANLYKKENIIDELFPITISCDENLNVIEKENLSIPCGQCWWCQERLWGFKRMV
jgi:hypothetical protein